jgi:hypothetical protein
MALGRRAMLSAAAALVLCGCGAGDPAAAQAASSFGAALGAGDLTRACELLAPATRATLEYQQSRACPQAMHQDNLSAGAVLQVEVWGGEARARTSSDTWFLTRTSRVACCRRRLRPAGPGRSLPVQGEWAMRNVRVLFIAYLVVIAVGLAYFITLGVLHR